MSFSPQTVATRLDTARRSTRAPVLTWVEAHPLRHDPQASRLYLVDLGWRSPQACTIIETDPETTVCEFLHQAASLTDYEFAAIMLHVPYPEGKIAKNGNRPCLSFREGMPRERCQFEVTMIDTHDEIFDSSYPWEPPVYPANDTLVTELLPDAARTVMWSTSNGGWGGIIRCIELGL